MNDSFILHVIVNNALLGGNIFELIVEAMYQ